MSNTTVYSKIYAKIYSNSLEPRVSPIVESDEEALSLYGNIGRILYCVYDSYDSNQYIKLQVAESKVGDPMQYSEGEDITYHYVYTESGNISALCSDSLSIDQESDLQRVISKNLSISEVSLMDLHLKTLFGEVEETHNNRIITNLNHTVPTNCSKKCPVGQCAGTAVEQNSFLTTDISFNVSKSTSCKRVTATYMRSSEPGNSTGLVLTDNQIRSFADPCGLPLACIVQSLSNYESVLVLRADAKNPSGAPKINITVGNNQLECLTDPRFINFVPERIIYTDGDCSKFRDNECLSEGFEVGKTTIHGTKTLSNTIIVNHSVSQECPEQICGSEYCTETEPTVVQEVSSKNNNGAIVGGIIGSITFILITLGIFAVTVATIIRAKNKSIIRIQDFSLSKYLKN